MALSKMPRIFVESFFFQAYSLVDFENEFIHYFGLVQVSTFSN